MSADTDHSRSSRRPRPEVHIYRPGSGPLKKSGSNAENILPSTSSHSSTRSDSGHDLASSLRAVTLNSETVDGGRAKSLAGDVVHSKASRSKKNQGRKQERSENKSQKGDSQNNPSGNEQKSKGCEKQPSPPMPPSDKIVNIANSNQDLRQLILEKRMQRSNQSPSGNSNRDGSTDMHRRDSNTSISRHPGKFDKNETTPSPQPSKSGEMLKNGHASGSNQSNNTTQRNDNEQQGLLSRNSEARGSRRRKDRPKPQRVEASRSEGHLSSLATSSISGATAATTTIREKSQPVENKNTNEKKEISDGGNVNGKGE